VGPILFTDVPRAVNAQPSNLRIEAPAGSGGLGGRAVALAEVLAAFVIVHVSYRSFKHFTDLGRAETASGLNFSPGAAMTLFTIGVLVLFRRSFETYGLTAKGWAYSLNIGLIWSVLFIAVAALVIKLAALRFDPLHPPDFNKALVAAVGEVINLVLILLLLRRDRAALRRLPPAGSLLLLLALLSIPFLLALALDRPLANTLLTVLWLFLSAGFGEEIFFRGYIQSRVNQAFGRPFQLLGANFGWGLLVSAALFGFIHVLNTVDYVGGRFDFAWSWWLPNFAGGLFYGLLRERTNSILAGAIIHGLSDVASSVPALLS
jgi:membrane protease YdiL (CAAX protease family)